MGKEVSFIIEEDIYEKFCLALSLNKDKEEKAVETCFRWYIAQTFEKISKEYGIGKDENCEIKGKGNFYAKAIRRIPVWAMHPEQYCHKIIRGFFLCQERNGTVMLNDLENACSNKEVVELYVPTFRNNYYQMKIDGAKTYGKIFEDNGNEVRIWSEVEAVLMEYKNYFCS